MNRKLAKEIDQTYKRINEGMDQFDRIHEKLSSAPTQSLRDKFEAELKKEIKKLQRCRDSIKQWLSGSEVKDKTELLKYRRMVETKMEQFKSVEKESKMKAYSKEALAKKTRDSKRRKKLDKRGQRNLSKIDQWVDQLQEQLDENDDALQEIQESKRPDQEEVDRLEEIIRKHRSYIEKLNETSRLLKKGTIDSSDVEQIADDIEYYIEDHQDPDFYENELLFDVIMEKKEGTYESEDNGASELLEIPEVDEDAVQEAVEIPQQPVLRINDIVPAKPEDEKPQEEEKKTPEPSPKPTVVAKEKEKKSKKNKEKNHSPSPQPTSNVTSATSSATTSANVTPQPTMSYRDIIASEDKKKNKKAAEKNKTPTPAATTTVSEQQKIQLSTTKQASPVPNVYAPNVTPPSVAAEMQKQQQQQQQQSERAPFSSQASQQDPVIIRNSPLENRLMRSMGSIPSEIDTERPDAFVPKNAVDVPSFFPQQRHPKFNTPEFFSQLETTDPLFFAFYFQQGEYQQQLAAEELKSKQWRFLAPKYMAWFQRHSQPTETNDKFEKGTYVYFDYDKDGWTPRIKQNFVFSYADVFNG